MATISFLALVEPGKTRITLTERQHFIGKLTYLHEAPLGDGALPIRHISPHRQLAKVIATAAANSR